MKNWYLTNSIELKSDSKTLDPYKPRGSNEDLIFIPLEPIINLIGFLILTKFKI